MKKKLQLLTRALVVIARDMFIGFIIGVSATVLMAGINPQTRNVVALFIPAGIAAGLFKGLAKFIFLNIFSSLPSKGYRHDYPKFKMALLWVALMLLVLVYSYGLNPLSWFREPLLLLQRNIILRDIGQSYWVAISVLVSVSRKIKSAAKSSSGQYSKTRSSSAGPFIIINSSCINSV